MTALIGVRSTDHCLVELTFWVCELRGLSAPKRPASRRCVRAASSDELPLLLAAKGGGRDEALRWLASGHQPYVALVGGAVGAYGWVASTAAHIGDLERDICLAPGDAYIFDCETLPAYRRKGLYIAILRQIVCDLAAAGMRRAWIGAVSNNTASKHGIARAGFTHVANLFYQRAGPQRMLLVVPRPHSSDAQVEAIARALDGEIALARA